MIIPVGDVDYYLKKIRGDPSLKGAIGRAVARILYANQNSPLAERYTICKDILMMMPAVIYTRKDFYLMEVINEKIQYFKAAGLVNYWHFHVKKLDDGSVPRRVLNFQDLSGAFQILLYGCCSSFLVFIMEKLFLIAKCRTGNLFSNMI